MPTLLELGLYGESMLSYDSTVSLWYNLTFFIRLSSRPVPVKKAKG